MGSVDWILELVLVGLLGLTLVHAVRLERALRVLRDDRAALGEALAGLDTSAKEAEAGVGKLQAATAESVAALSARLEKSIALKDDLDFLIQRGEALADRLDGAVRGGLKMGAGGPAPSPTDPTPKVRSQAERDLLLALRAGQ